ncbi:MAG: hypothetical protein GY910_27830 [bacterium]|nr:hypothetical protein [Deltaproteobacteria bacterium]MCP4908804.1 hypothetical protein [bacterium]
MDKVIQWSTGNIGRQTLAAIIDHPDLELVGVYAFDSAKVGLDAGELCHRGRTGIETTGDVDALVEMEADCVCLTPVYYDEEILVRLLRSGKNVVASGGFIHPEGVQSEAFMERIEAACREGGSSIFGSGVNPGFINAITILLTHACRQVESVTWDEFSYAGLYNSPESWSYLGLGLSPEEREKRGASALPDPGAPNSLDFSGFAEAVRLTAGALGLEIDEYQFGEEAAVATRPIRVAWTTYEVGTVAGLRHWVTGIVAGKPVLTGRVNWYMGLDLEPNWIPERSTREYLGRIAIEGEPSIHCDFGIGQGSLHDPRLIENAIDPALVATAMPIVNAIPVVCRARPGIRTYLDLPMMAAKNLVKI